MFAQVVECVDSGCGVCWLRLWGVLAQVVECVDSGCRVC